MSTPEDQQKIHLPFYWAAMVASLSGIAAAALAVESTGFLLLASSLVCLGYQVSIKLRIMGKSLRIVEGVVILICLATYARLFATGDTFFLLNPGLAMIHKELALAVMLVWAEVVRSYSLVSDESVLFAAVPSLALIGIVATANPGYVNIYFFAVWLVACIWMFAENERMKSGRDLGGRREKARPQEVMRSRALSLAGALGLGSLAVGLLVSPVVQRSSMWAFLNIAPDIYSTRQALELAMGDSETNRLEISEGPVKLSSREVMTVKSEREQYWRTRVWDVYQGNSWQSSSDSFIEHPEVRTLGREDKEFVFYDRFEPPQTQLVEQTFVSSDYFKGYLPGAAEIKRIRITTDALKRDNFNSIRIASQNMRQSVQEYTVWSQVPNAGTDQLRNASTQYPSWIMRRYTGIPPGELEVAQKAKEITRGLNNPYDKVQALKEYIISNCTYDLSTPAMPRGKHGAVSYFLFESRRGYCDVFSSSLAVMARSIGIPARIATGYLPGEYDPQRDLYVVREKDMHSWTEIYFPGYGWIAFEATPSADTPEPGFMQNLLTEVRLMFADNTYRFLMALAVIGMAVFTHRLFSLDRRPISPVSARPVSPDIKKAQGIWRKLTRLVERTGAPINRYGTPLELYLSADAFWDKSHTEAREALFAATSLLNEILYGGRKDGAEELGEDLWVAARWAERQIRKIPTTARIPR